MLVVSMIVRIACDIRFFVCILAFVLVGFSIAFWLISYPVDGYPDQGIDNTYGNITTSLKSTFLLMFGMTEPNFDNSVSAELGYILVVLFAMFIILAPTCLNY